MSSISLRVLPGFAAVFEVPLEVIEAFMEKEDTSDVQEGVNAFLYYFEHQVHSYTSAVSSDGHVHVYMEEADNVIKLLVSRAGGLTFDNIDEAYYTSPEFLLNMLSEDAQDSLSFMFLKLIDDDYIEDLLDLLSDMEIDGDFMMFISPQETYLYTEAEVSDKVKFLLSEFTEDISGCSAAILCTIIDSASRVVGIELNSKEGGYKCQTLQSRKAFTRKQNRRLKKVWNKLKAYTRRSK